MEAAMAAEIKAEKFYSDALQRMAKGDLHDLFAELAAQEVEHQRLIADMMAKLPPAEDLQREDVADEPVSQD
jgi:rubrerythrin